MKCCDPLANVCKPFVNARKYGTKYFCKVLYVTINDTVDSTGSNGSDGSIGSNSSIGSGSSDDSNMVPMVPLVLIKGVTRKSCGQGLIAIICIVLRL